MIIYKYTIPFVPSNIEKFVTYSSAKIIKVAIQHKLITLWVAIDDNDPKVTKECSILVTGTGWRNEGISVADAVKGYLDTLFFEDGTVWHVFEM